MDQPLNTRLEFDEGAKVDDAGDGAAHAVVHFVVVGSRVPRLRQKLLHPNRDAALAILFGDFQNLDINLIAGGKDIGGLADAAPRNVADVQQGVDAANIDEGTIVREGADGAR